MPLFDYKCRSCGKVDEMLVPTSEKKTNICTDCGGISDQQVPATNFTLKGDGWPGKGSWAKQAGAADD